MFKMFKKMFSTREAVSLEIDDDPNDRCIEMLSQILGDSDLKSVMFDSSAKLYLLNMYSHDLYSLIMSMYGSNLGDEVNCINIYSYADENFNSFKLGLEELKKELDMKKVRTKAEHDIAELYKAYCVLSGKEEDVL